MLKLFGRQSVEYPNARNFERKKLTRFENVRPRMCETSPAASRKMVNIDSQGRDVREQHQPDKQVIGHETPLSPVPVSNNLDCASEVSPSILRAALPMRFAELDSTESPASIHDAFNSQTD